MQNFPSQINCIRLETIVFEKLTQTKHFNTKQTREKTNIKQFGISIFIICSKISYVLM